MAIHCFDVVYKPNASMDSFLDTWLTNWNGWTEENLDEPQQLNFSNLDTGSETVASGFTQNRFEIADSSRTLEEDRDVIISQLTGPTGYLEAYTDWGVVRWHVCDHDEADGSGCGSWQTIHEHGTVPDEVF